MASDIETVARPYAEAAYGYASEQGEVDQWEKMLGFAAAVSADSRVAPLINGTLSADELAAAFCGLLGYDISKEKKTGEPAIDRHCANFLRVMSENGRLSLMPEVFRQFEERAEKDRNVLSVEVVSASALPEADLSRIRKIAEKHWHCKAAEFNGNCGSHQAEDLAVQRRERSEKRGHHRFGKRRHHKDSRSD